jgi:hypothetical protein
MGTHARLAVMGLDVIGLGITDMAASLAFLPTAGPGPPGLRRRGVACGGRATEWPAAGLGHRGHHPILRLRIAFAVRWCTYQREPLFIPRARGWMACHPSTTTRRVGL